MAGLLVGRGFACGFLAGLGLRLVSDMVRQAWPAGGHAFQDKKARQKMDVEEPRRPRRTGSWASTGKRLGKGTSEDSLWKKMI